MVLLRIWYIWREGSILLGDFGGIAYFNNEKGYVEFIALGIYEVFTRVNTNSLKKKPEENC